MRQIPRAIPVFLFLLILTACGGSITKNVDKSLATSLTATNAARESFVAFDKDYQLALVDQAGTREDAESALAQYRYDRGRLLRAFTAAYSAIGAASAMVPLVERGEKKDADLRAILFDAVRAALEVKNAVDQIKGGK